MIEKSSVSLDTFFMPGDAFVSDETLVKQASLASGTRKYVQESLDPDDDGLIVIVNGMGASEYWGPNVNGDWFGEKALTNKQTKAEAAKNPGDACGKRLKRYKTFNNGHVFEHHDNDDPEKKIGDVLETFWHPRMNRVEIVTFVTDDRGKEKIIRKRKKGKPMPVSMGCKVPEDYCSICGNAAPTTADYCDHLKHKMGEVLDDGRKVYAINKQPRFFDLSHVTVPADKTAYALKYIEPDGVKEGSAREFFGTPAEDGHSKTASDKHSDIDKEVEPQGGNQHRYLKEEELRRMNPDKPIESISSLVAGGVMPKEAELQWICMRAFDKHAAEEACRNNIVFETPDSLSKVPDEIEETVKNASPQDSLILDLEDYVRDNSIFSPVEKEAQMVVDPKPVPLPDAKNITSQSEEASMRGAAGITGGAILGSMLSKLMDAIDSGSEEVIKRLLSKQPGLRYVLMSVLGAGASGSYMASETPDSMMGRT